MDVPVWAWLVTIGVILAMLAKTRPKTTATAM